MDIDHRSSSTDAITLTRRALLWRAAAASCAIAGVVSAADAAWNAAAFAARDVDAALRALGGARPDASALDGVAQLIAPDLFEDGAVVPLTLRSTVGAPRCALLVDKNPTALVAVFDLTAAVVPDIGLRIKMAETSAVRLAVWSADGRAVATQKVVRVVQGGCGDGPEAADEAPRPPGPMRLRARRAGATTGAAETVVRALISHPMETGLRKDGAGRPVAAWHITDIEARHNGAVVWTAQWGNAVAADPYLEFKLRDAAAGDSVGLHWSDNRGFSRSDEVRVA